MAAFAFCLLAAAARAEAQSQPKDGAISARGLSTPLVLLDAGPIPSQRRQVVETEREEWYFIPERSDLHALREAGKDAFGVNDPQADLRYRRYSPLVVYSKVTKEWRAAGISYDAWAIYPVEHDPFDADLIWFGCNDGPPGMHADYAGGVSPNSPLRFGGKPGGLGLLNLRERTIRYFGPYLHLVGSRVYRVVFDKEAVWTWGSYPLGGEANGISRYRRDTGEMEPFPLPDMPSRSWTVQRFTSSPDGVWLTVGQGSSNRRYHFDGKAEQWDRPSYAWAVGKDVPLLAEPSPNAIQRATVPGITDPGRQERQAYLRSALQVLGRRDRWLHVVTRDDQEGWVEAAGVKSTPEVFRMALDAYLHDPEHGDGGPCRFIRNAHHYETPAELTDALALLQDAATTASEPHKKALEGILVSAGRDLRDAREQARSFRWRAERLRRGREW
ncbi:MAG: hypothetical protein HY321_03095 [Armatimonadetes bacterium]|nr:hypothetical protein [Armatimonadota bacterium]